MRLPQSLGQTLTPFEKCAKGAGVAGTGLTEEAVNLINDFHDDEKTARDFVNSTSSGTPTGLYRQSYQYSSFNQVTQQMNRLWSQTETATNRFLNNRRQSWGYDAAGELTYADGTSYTRDAAGRNTQTDSETSHGTYTFDGDGKALKTVLTTPACARWRSTGTCGTNQKLFGQRPWNTCGSAYR